MVTTILKYTDTTNFVEEFEIKNEKDFYIVRYLQKPQKTKILKDNINGLLAHKPIKIKISKKIINKILLKYNKLNKNYIFNNDLDEKLNILSCTFSLPKSMIKIILEYKIK